MKKIIVLSLMITISSIASAETISLKNGKNIRGKIIARTAYSIDVALTDGTERRIYAGEIKDINNRKIRRPVVFREKRESKNDLSDGRKSNTNRSSETPLVEMFKLRSSDKILRQQESSRNLGAITDNESNFDAQKVPVDSDGDGLYDAFEKNQGTNPNSADSDGDGLSDYQEYGFKINPNSNDSDQDGVNDYQELINGTDPLNPNEY